MILLDTSGLLAALDAAEPQHEAARAALEGEAALLLSPFVLAELDYLLGKRVGVDAQLALLREIEGGAYDLVSFDSGDVAAAGAVVEQYREHAVGLADASLVVLAARFRTERVLTFDERHFRVLRAGRRPFVLLPADV